MTAAWRARVALVTLFFSWGLLSVMVDMTIPYFKSAFDLGYRDALLVQSSFFLAYLFLARLAGRITARIGFRNAARLGVSLMAVGSLALALTTLLNSYLALLPSVFVLASGITFLQVSANPLAAALGGTRSAAGNLTLVQGFNSLGTVAAPLIASFALLGVAGSEAGSLAEVRALFSVLAAFLVLLAIWVGRAFASVEGATGSTVVAGHYTLDQFAKRRLVAGSLAIFAYVGAEVSIASTLVNFLESESVAGLSREQGARVVAFYWGGALAGRFLSVPLLTRFPRECLLTTVTLAAAGLAAVALATRGEIAMVAILGIGLFNAIQFPVIFATTSSDLEPEARARAAGWLCTGIVGGAVVPLAYGQLADVTNLHWALFVPITCYLYICAFALAFGKERETLGAAV